MQQDKRIVEMDEPEYQLLRENAESLFRAQVQSVTGSMIYNFLMKNRAASTTRATVTFEDNGFSEDKDKCGMAYKVRRMTVTLKEEN